MKVKLPDLDPVTREGIAAWIDWLGAMHGKRIPEAQAMIAAGHGGNDLVGQVAYWKACVSFSKFLSYRVRVGRTRKLKSPSEPQPKQK